jgi:hypothetical protein
MINTSFDSVNVKKTYHIIDNKIQIWFCISLSMSKNKKNSTIKSEQGGLFSVQNLLSLLLLVIVTSIAFSPSLSNQFTNWDDPTYVYENPMVMSEQTQWKQLFTEPVSLNYHPITMLTLAWNYQRAEKADGKIDPYLFHLWNVVIHVFSVVLMFLFVFRLSRSNWFVSFFCAAIFALHPMHVESVSWISERKDVLYVLFFLLACFTYLRFKEKESYVWLALTLLFFILSVLSKAVAVVLPVVLLLIDYYTARKIHLKQLLFKMPFFILSFYYGWKAYSIQSTEAIASSTSISLFQQFVFGSWGALMYIFKFFIPIKLSAFYPYPELVTSGNIPTEYYLGFIIWPLTAGAIYIGYRFYQPLLFGILFYFITIGLVLQFISVGSAIMADRYSYLPYLGLAYPIAHFLYDLYKKKATLKIPVYATTAAFFIFISISTYARTQVWKDNISLWSDVINKYPTVEVAYKNRGNYYGKELGKVDEAYKDYMVLKRMNSKDTKVYSNMGNVYGMRQQPDSAIWCYNKAIALDPNNEEAYINRGITYSMMKQFANAINDFNSAEKIKGLSLSILQNRAYTLLAAGRYSESAKDYQELIRLKPNDALTYYYSALAQEGSGNIALSKQHLQQAISLGYQVDEATRTRIIQK